MIDCGPKHTAYGKALERCLTEAYELAENAKAHTACTLIDEALIAACRADLRIAELEAGVEQVLDETRAHARCSMSGLVSAGIVEAWSERLRKALGKSTD